MPVNAPIFTVDPLADGELPSIRLRKLRFVQPEEIKTVLKDLMSEGALISSSGQMLILVDTARQIRRASRILASLDVPAFDGTEMRLYDLDSIDAEQAVTTLNTLTSSLGLAGQGAGLSFVDMPGGQSLLMIAKDPTIVRQGENLLRLVDRPIDAPGRAGGTSTPPQNTSAQSLVQAFEQYFPDRMESSPEDPSETGVRFVPFTKDSSGLGVSSGAGGARGGGGGRTLLIYATPRDYEDMLTLFAELDRPPKQVNMRHRLRGGRAHRQPGVRRGVLPQRDGSQRQRRRLW